MSLLAELDGATVDVIDGRYEIEHGRLTGAVGADETYYLFLVHDEVQVDDDLEATEALVDLVENEKRIASCHDPTLLVHLIGPERASC